MRESRALIPPGPFAHGARQPCAAPHAVQPWHRPLATARSATPRTLGPSTGEKCGYNVATGVRMARQRVLGAGVVSFPIGARKTRHGAIFGPANHAGHGAWRNRIICERVGTRKAASELVQNHCLVVCSQAYYFGICPNQRRAIIGCPIILRLLVSRPPSVAVPNKPWAGSVCDHHVVG